MKNLISITVWSVLFIACNPGKKSPSTKVDEVKSTHEQTQPATFNSYLDAIPQVTLPYHFSYENITAENKNVSLDTAKLTAGKGSDYYEPDPDAAYAQLSATYRGAVAYPLFRYKINDTLSAVAYTFQKVSSGVVRYPFVELLTYNTNGKIKGRQVIASGNMDAEHTENTTFSILTTLQIKTVNNMTEYRDSTRTGAPLNFLQDKKDFYIKPNGKIITTH
jgi:hypothetical protein